MDNEREAVDPEEGEGDEEQAQKRQPGELPVSAFAPSTVLASEMTLHDLYVGLALVGSSGMADDNDLARMAVEGARLVADEAMKARG